MAEGCVPTSVILIGNPGAGKSTLLNALLEHYDPGKQFERFESGVSIGTGLTTATKRVKVHDKIFVDTPGLSDIKTRKQAAIEIYDALKTAGHCQIIFVVTLESGRIRPDDTTTIRLVLDASPDITNYGIIFNKLSTKIMDQIRKDFNILRHLLVEIQPLDDHITSKNPFAFPLPIERIAELDDEKNVHVSIPQLTYFLENALFTVTVIEQNVHAIKEGLYDAIKENMETELGAMREDRARKLQKIDNLKMRIKIEEKKKNFDFKKMIKKFVYKGVRKVDRLVGDLTQATGRHPRQPTI